MRETMIRAPRLNTCWLLFCFAATFCVLGATADDAGGAAAITAFQEGRSLSACSKACATRRTRRARRRCTRKCQAKKRVCPKEFGGGVEYISLDNSVCTRSKFSCDQSRQWLFQTDTFLGRCGCGCINVNTADGATSGNQCREPRPAKCSKELKPVSCNGCKYNNICLAEAAGYNENECKGDVKTATTSKCPKPADGIFCISQYNPTFCRHCIYSNPCFAEAAGFDIRKRKICLQQQY